MNAVPDDLLAANLGVLEHRAPGLARDIAAVATPPSHVLSRAPGGEPLLSVGGITLQHPRDPHGDGVRWARAAVERLEASGAARALIVGLGLGYHVEALAERFAGEIVVVEPDLAVWRCALESRDLRPLLGRIVAWQGDEAEAAPGGVKARVLQHAPSALRADGSHRQLFERLVGRSAATGLRLRVLVVSPIAGGSLPIARYATRALRALGHEVRLLDLSRFHDGLAGLASFGARRVRTAELESALCNVVGMGVAAAAESFAPDLVLALAQAPLDARALAAIGRTGAIRALWFVEDFRRFTYWREVVSQYEHVLTIQTDDCFAALREAGDARLTYLPCAFDPEEHRPIDLTEDERDALGSDVSFVGAGYRNRRVAFRRFLDLDFRIWGSEWGGAAELERFVQRDAARISTDESVRIFNATRVNLNLHSSTYHDGVDPQGDFVNPRTFELAGCGAFQVVDHRRLLPDLFVPERELAVARDVHEMRELTRYFLAHPDERFALAQRAHARALAAHTYQHRMQDLVAAVVAQDQDRLLARSRPPTFGEAAARESGALRALLERHPASAPLGLDAIVRDIGVGSGDVAEEEAIFLFLHQFQELYLAEARA
ncbi:glycosyltransferase [Candidatus Binatia bacterium]|nr:glycosyltransferase [Candidatus Binatia bacterium]